MARIRTFIAVELGAGVKDRLTRLQESLGTAGTGVKWTRPDNMHLTLLFLGEVEELEVVAICRAVQETARKHEPFTAEVAGLGGFPNTRRPKILWAGVTAGLEELRALHADLEHALLDLGCYRREERAYTPHLTLGRLSHDERADQWGPVLAQHGRWEGGTVPVDEVVVLSSEPGREGPQYSVMGRAALSGE